MDFSTINERLSRAIDLGESLKKILPEDPSEQLEFTTEFSECRTHLTQFLQLNLEVLGSEISFGLSNVIHQFRSILDNIAFLVVGSSMDLDEQQARRIYFPITASDKDWGNSRAAKIIRENCEQKFVNLFYELQPFRGILSWEESQLQPLKVLSDLNNSDKHRELKLVKSLTLSNNMKMSFEFYSEDEALMPEMEINPEVLARGGPGVFRTITAKHPIKSVSGNDDFSIEFRVPGYDLEVFKLIADIGTCIGAIVSSFENVRDLDDWELKS